MSLTAIFMISIVVIIALFDVYIIAKKGKQESISAYIIRGSKNYPLLVLLFGILLGHLFWSMRTEDIYYNTECITKEEQ
jgi:predicted permease